MTSKPMADKAKEKQEAAEYCTETVLEFSDNRLFAQLCGQFDSTIGTVEQAFSLQIIRRGNRLMLLGNSLDARAQAQAVLKALYTRLENGAHVDPIIVESILQMQKQRHKNIGVFWPDADGAISANASAESLLEPKIKTPKRLIEPRTQTQRAFIKALLKERVVFGIGPAGTGKTYVALAAGVKLLDTGAVERLILSRPAVEAGERLGFLPGDMKEKVDPYMQPLYDALSDFIYDKRLARLIEEGIIEIAPLAFMRGRTLKNAFIMLDEAQNATPIQMKMFLTRLGEGSHMAITGDPFQIDLPAGVQSGLNDAEQRLQRVRAISFTRFSSADNVRDPLVVDILKAYGI